MTQPAARIVRLGPDDPRGVPVPRTVAEALAEAPTWSSDLRPGRGRTVELWERLATYAAADVAVARAVEPHLDALAILDQAGADVAAPTSGTTWGVYAAEGPEASLVAASGDGSWRLTGVKPWCSLATQLDAALVTAKTGDGTRGLFTVDLRDRRVAAVDQPWSARGLVEIPSTPVRFETVPATWIAPGEWYLERPGFWWGAVGVAACWYGGAVGVGRRVHAAAARRPDDRLLAMHLGRIDERLEAARTVLAAAALAVDRSGAETDGGVRPEAPGARAGGRLLAKRARATVARTCEDVLSAAGHALGPGPLTQDDAHAKQVADLQVYVRQHHAERDEASLGAALAQLSDSPW